VTKRRQTVKKTSTVEKTSVVTYTREGYLPRRYRAENSRSVSLGKGYLLRRYQGDRDRPPGTSRGEKLALDLHYREQIEVDC